MSKEMDKIVSRLAILRTWEKVNPMYGKGLDIEECNDAVQWLDDAIELLKEKEPVKPFVGNYWKNSMGRCGHCKAPLPALEGLRSKFCWMCGRPVKWDE